MIKRGQFAVLTSSLIAVSSTPGLAQMMKSELSPHADAQEKKLIDEASHYLQSRYPTPEAAGKAGFIRFTPEDRTGAISWANLHWTSTDFEHPSQVWYDAHGRLIGVDYSVLQADHPQPPQMWGVDPRRWTTFHEHVHYGLRMPDGSVKFGATSTAKFKDAGGSLASPTKQTLVKMGIAKSPSDVAFVFLFPSIWDLEFWVIPNPNGRFADYNPNVKPRNAQPHPGSM
jgi:hypothetical protein